ncbi:hypothetical protein F0562_020223 [Nyssa sinensis]|uniref:Uncharacterized protein n=1 Tax=Nyssa sinensis TaxID=561372 RepID=A0A5J5BR86_9ASTE|nr:hypothetical protein F0562_020223 [Nyssa sinensis]
MRKKNSIQKKDEIAEDWCFVCKDGGQLIVCDHKHCPKSYHPECVGKDESFLETGNRWTCNWHSCFICHATAKFHCFCCPNAVCQHCITAAEFVRVRGKNGFCNNCLKLAILVEENLDVDSDGGRVDFKDRETYEFLFMEYWEIIKEKEGLTLENLHSADFRLKKGKDYRSGSDAGDSDKGEEYQLISSNENSNDIEEDEPVSKRKRSKGRRLMKRKEKLNKKEFVGWGSKSLIQFLASIGKKTSKKLSQHEVTSIINGYINENKLFHPEKKKIICDEKLQSVLGRKELNRSSIHDFLEAHFAENMEQSEEDEFGYNSEDEDEDEDENVFVACKRQRKMSTDIKSQKKEVMFDFPPTCFASIVAENIKLVYLKRSLVEELLKQPETFESKVMGSFVRVRSDSSDDLKKKSHQLAQVTGITSAIKTTSGGENCTEILLQISNIPIDIHICMLSDDYFTEEECEDLRQNVKNGLLKRPTVVELEQKARSLHEDITKHWIVKELALLQNLIDRANEKGWRNQLFEYLERRQLLQTSSEQSLLLQKVPKVIPDVAQLEPFSKDYIKNGKQGNKGSSKSIFMGSLGAAGDKKAGKISLGDGAVINRNSSCGNIGSIDGDGSGQAKTSNTAKKNTKEGEGHHGYASTPEEKQSDTATCVLKEPSQQSHVPASEVQHHALQPEPHQSISEDKHTLSKASVIGEQPQQSHFLAPENQSNVILQNEPHQSSCTADGNQTQPIDTKQGNEGKPRGNTGG